MVDDQVKKATELLEILKTKKAIDKDAIDLVKEGFKLKNIPLELTAQFFEAKLLYLFRNAKNAEGLVCCDELEKFIDNNSKLLYYTVCNERYRILYYYGVGEKTEAVYTGDKIIQKVKDVADDKIQKKLSDIYWITGGLATNIGDYDKCTRYLNEALRIAKKYQLREIEGSIYAALGDIYHSNNEVENAIKYLDLGIQHSQSPSPTNITCSMLCRLGEIYMDLDKHKAAENCFLKALEINKVLQHPRTHVIAKLYMAKHYCKHKQIDAFLETKAELEHSDYFNQDQELKAEILYLDSEVCLLEKNYSKALELANKFEEDLVKQKGLLSIQKAYELKLKIYKALKDYEHAVEYYEKILEIKEKILNEKNKKHLQEFEMKFQNERKEKEIQALKLESVSFQLQSLRAQMNPHFVFNTIASISQDLHPETIAKSQALLESFARLMRSNLDFADQDKITLDDEIKFLNDYLLLEQNRMGDKLKFSIDFDEDLDLDFIEIPSMLIQPYIENAVKHGIMPLEGLGEIIVSFKENGDQLICTIEDNGIGRKAAEIRKNRSSAHLGKSTSINAKRLALLSPELKENLKVEFTEKVNDKGEAQGTMVQIVI